jgi:hypothetical protein
VARDKLMIADVGCSVRANAQAYAIQVPSANRPDPRNGVSELG